MEQKKRYIILDALRGFAILGICLANFPEFSLWTFLSDDAREALSPMAGALSLDGIVRFLQYFLVDGKFYTLFSLLFGVGFSIILSNAVAAGKNGIKRFYRRMAALLLIGLAHLMLLWSGDILMLYALMGMLLPLLRKLPDRKLLVCAAVLLVLPVVSDAVQTACAFDLAAPLEREQWRLCGLYGITSNNFATWLRDAHSYREVLQFLVQGSVERMWEFVSGHRYFKVLGLFLIGYCVGRNRVYADLGKYRDFLLRVWYIGLGLGLPLSFLYAVSAMNGAPLGMPMHSALYLVSVYPLGFAYAAGFCLLFMKHEHAGIWKAFSYPGKTACTNYLLQSVLGILIFYGIGLGLGASVSLALTELIALGVYLLEMLLSALWLKRFRQGPVEWLWRRMYDR